MEGVAQESGREKWCPLAVMTNCLIVSSPFPPNAGKITERFFLHALDRYWHNSCLKCSCCGAMLADIGSSCYTRSGMILCKADYSRLVAV